MNIPKTFKYIFLNDQFKKGKIHYCLKVLTRLLQEDFNNKSMD